MPAPGEHHPAFEEYCEAIFELREDDVEVIQARIEAESCLRIIEKHDASDDKLFRARCIHVKEERAELVKHHLDVLWHDYFKPEHLETYPQLHELFWNATKEAGNAKRSEDPAQGQKLLDAIDELSKVFWETKSA